MNLALKSVTITGAMLLLFAVEGGLALNLLHISLPAFRVAGKILQALTLTFASPGLSSMSDRKPPEAQKLGEVLRQCYLRLSYHRGLPSVCF